MEPRLLGFHNIEDIEDIENIEDIEDIQKDRDTEIEAVHRNKI